MNAWREAATELGIRVEVPFSVISGDGTTELYHGLVVDFYDPMGVVLGELDDDTESHKALLDAGYRGSLLAPCYQTNDRELFIATLDDWKWCGPLDWHQHGIPARIGASARSRQKF
jgi:hypothetical protein